MDNNSKSTNLFSINLKKFIKNNNMTNKELAEKLGVTPSTITSYINGSAYPRMDKINKLCEIFKITNNELFEDVNSIKYNFDIPETSYTVKEPNMPYYTFDYSNIMQLINNIKSLYKNGDISDTSVIDLNLIINSFSQLNQLGQAELAKRSNEMTEIGKFKK